MFEGEKLRIITLGALLHDIGKVVQRALGSKENHGICGKEFLREFNSEDLDLISIFCEFHHERDLRDEERLKERIKEMKELLQKYGISEEELREMLEIVHRADMYSAKEREGERVPTGKYRLLSPFVKLQEGAKRQYYVAKPLDIFSMLKLEPEPETSPGEYLAIYRELNRSLSALSKVYRRIDPYNVLVLLEKYTSLVSSYTTEDNDISLYDHLRTTAAIASSLYSGDRNSVLLVEGDFSGIQKFIYGIRGAKGSLKYLRARSTFLVLLSYDIILEILERLKLSPANILFNGGGNFIMILPNSDEAKGVLEEIRREVEEWLFSSLGGSLYFALEWTEVKAEKLAEKFGEYLGELHKKLSRRKMKRYSEILEEIGKKNEGAKISPRMRECPICGREVQEADLIASEELEEEICPTCIQLYQLGKDLPKCLGFWRSKNEIKGISYLECPFSRFYILKGDLKAILSKLKGVGAGIYVPKIDWRGGRRDFSDILLDVLGKLGEVRTFPMLTGDYAKIKEEAVITFEELAKTLSFHRPSPRSLLTSSIRYLQSRVLRHARPFRPRHC